MALCASDTSMNRSIQTQWIQRANGDGDTYESGVDVLMEFVPSMVHTQHTYSNNNNNNNMHYIGIIMSLA